MIAVMLSTVGTLETSILQFTRTLYAKGRDGIVHPRYAILHKRWRTPWVATAMITAIGLLLLFGASYFPSVSAIIKDSVNAIGFQVAFYYGLAGFACAWRFRREALRSVFNLVFLLVWPLFSALFLWFIAVYSVPTFDLATNVVGLGGIALGVVPLMLNRRMAARAAAGWPGAPASGHAQRHACRRNVSICMRRPTKACWRSAGWARPLSSLRAMRSTACAASPMAPWPSIRAEPAIRWAAVATSAAAPRAMATSRSARSCMTVSQNRSMRKCHCRRSVPNSSVRTITICAGRVSAMAGWTAARGAGAVAVAGCGCMVGERAACGCTADFARW